jgi:hypothetical protein
MQRYVGVERQLHTLLTSVLDGGEQLALLPEHKLERLQKKHSHGGIKDETVLANILEHKNKWT